MGRDNILIEVKDLVKYFPVTAGVMRKKVADVNEEQRAEKHAAEYAVDIPGPLCFARPSHDRRGYHR